MLFLGFMRQVARGGQIACQISFTRSAYQEHSACYGVPPGKQGGGIINPHTGHSASPRTGQPSSCGGASRSVSRSIGGSVLLVTCLRDLSAFSAGATLFQAIRLFSSLFPSKYFTPLQALTETGFYSSVIIMNHLGFGQNEVFVTRSCGCARKKGFISTSAFWTFVIGRMKSFSCIRLGSYKIISDLCSNAFPPIALFLGALTDLGPERDETLCR